MGESHRLSTQRRGQLIGFPGKCTKGLHQHAGWDIVPPPGEQRLDGVLVPGAASVLFLDLDASYMRVSNL